MNTTNPNPTCENECRFQFGMSSTTCMYFPPIYDKHGNNLNPDMNTTSGSIVCQTCKKAWKYSTTAGKTEFFVL